MAIVSALALVLMGAAGCSQKVTGPVSGAVPGTGLIVEDLQVGTGPAAMAGDTLTIFFTGTLEDGTPFDASTRRPFIFVIGRGIVIRGLDLGLLGMRAGGHRRITIPPALGYGAAGYPPVVPPDATLIFDVDLVTLAKAPRLLL
jgi:FKBP-type peptidyl-prolyl cis-trans isomerase